MYYIDDYRQQAINKIIPYLIEFPEIVSIIEDSADRYQAIEDVLWRIANNFKVVNSRGVFLNAHAHNEVVDLVYTDKAKDAFTYGTEFPETQAFGTGHFYSQASYLSGISKDVSEDKLIRAVQEKIIQNNTNGTIQDFIEAMKLHFNATSVNIYESYPLAISLMLSGEKLELSSSGNKEAIKKCLPACVSLNNLYIDDHLFDQFIYSNKSWYANDSRYPITLGNTDYLYKYISTAINLNSNDKEYIKINSPFYNADFTQNEIPFECICGQLTEINNNSAIYSFTYISTNIYKISLVVKQIEGENYFILSRDMWDDSNSIWENIDTINTNIKAEIRKDYTFLFNVNRNVFDFLNLWIFDGTRLIGQNILQDTSWAYNIIQNDINFIQLQLNTTNINYDMQNILNAEIINYANSDVGNHSNFTYYCILGGALNHDNNRNINNESSHYYITCFGEKNLLFNCLSNNNHAIINTNSMLQNNLTVKQSSYNYKKWHSNNKYFNVYNKNNLPSIKWGDGGYTTPVQIASYSLYDVAYGDGKFVAVGDKITTSTDGITWNDFEINANILESIIYKNGKFVAVGNSGYTTTSTDGITWTTPIRIGHDVWRSIAYGNGKFVAVGDAGYTTTSTDGITWTTPIRIGNNLPWLSIAYGNGKFVAVGNGGYTTTSTDGITWTTPIQVGDNTTSWYSIVYGDGKFVVVGNRGYTTTSIDGITWTTPIQVGNNAWNSISYGNGRFVAGGVASYTTTSTDGITWTTPIRMGIWNNTWNNISYINGEFIAVGSGGYIAVYKYVNDVIINSFELSFDLCFPINSTGNILNGLLGSKTNLGILYNSNLKKLTITLPTYTSGGGEVPYATEVNLTDNQFIKKFNNLKIKYSDNKIFVYVDDILLKTENILNVNMRYINAILELGPINAFIKNLIFNCIYTDGINVSNLKYNLPLIDSLYEKNNLIQPVNYNARFLTVPQLIDNNTNKDLFNNETLRKVNF